jgi:hypothetical protein
MELLYLTDISQIKYILDVSPNLLKKYTPITGDLVVSYELENLGINFIDEWDYLTPKTIEYNWILSNKLIKCWTNEAGVDPVYYEDISLSECAGQDLAYSFEAALNARVVYEKIIETHNVTCIAGFFLPEIAVIRTGPFPTHRAVRSISQAVLFWIAESRNIPVEKLESTYNSSNGIIKRKPLVGKPYTKSNIEFKESVEKIALALIDGLTQDEYNALKSTYNKLDRWDIIAVTKNDIKNIAALTKDRGEDPLDTLQTFLFSFQKYSGDFPEIFGNFYFNFQFESLFSEIGIASRLSHPFSAFLDILKPAVVIFGHEAFTIESALVEISKKKQIPTVSLFHGGLGPKFCFKGLVGKSDHIIVWNHWDKEILQSHGVDSNRINIIGSIRYEQKYRSEFLSKTVLDFNNNNKIKIKIKSLGLDPDAPVIVLLTAAINCGFAAPISNPRQHRNALKDIINFIQRRSDLQFIIKPHPSFDYYDLYSNLISAELPNLYFFEELSFDDVIGISSISILINYFTTAALESLINKTPVIFYQNAVYPLSDWGCSIVDLDIIEVSSISALESCIDDLNKSLTSRINLTNNTLIVEKVIGFSEKTVIVRFTDFINQLIIGKHYGESIAQLTVSPNEFLKRQQEFFENHYSNKEVLFVVFYIFGALKVGLNSLFTKKNTFSSKEWAIVLMSYVYSSRSNSISKDWKSTLFLLGFILTHPNMYLNLSSKNRSKLCQFMFVNGLHNDYLISNLKKFYTRILKS